MKSPRDRNANLTTQEAISKAKRMLKKGKLDEARQLYQSVIQADPTNKIARKALKNLGLEDSPKSYLENLYVLYEQGKHRELVDLGKSLLPGAGEDPELLNAIGVALKELKDISAAVEFLEKAIAIDPTIPEFHNNLGSILIAGKRYDEAIKALKEAVRLRGNYVEALANTGLAMSKLKRFTEAEKSLAAANRLSPNSPIILFNLGRNFQAKGELDNACDYYTKATLSNPDFPEAYSNLGTCYRERKLYSHAISSYKRALELRPANIPDTCNLVAALINAGKLDDALNQSHKALEASPDDPLVVRTMGNVLESRKDIGEAIAWYQKAVEMEPRNPANYNNLAAIQIRAKQLSQAKNNLLNALSLDPNHFHALANLGYALNELFEHSESLGYFDRALSISPNSPLAHSNLLFGLNYNPDLSAKEIFSYYQKYDDVFCAPFKAQWPKTYSRTSSGGKTKIGYLSPDFRKHPVTLYFLPILENHDLSKFRIYAYSELAVEDDITERVKAGADAYISSIGFSDEALASRIKDDGIDVLVDLAGHTDGNRLSMIARYKPAPVVVSFLGFGYTTGLSAVDYYLTDSVSAPPSSEDLFSETPWRFPSVPLLYRPSSSTGDPDELPALRKGYVTFGTLTRSIRINLHTISIWSEILKNVDKSRLILNSQSFADESVKEKLCFMFAEHGIDSDRLVIGFDTPPWDIYRQIDITLDCFPHNSGTTLIESLYQGVPFVTLCGRPSVGRLGASILKTVQREEWIAEDSHEYVSIAVALSENLTELSSIRASLRSEMEASPIMDEPGFTRELERAFADMCEMINNS